MVELLLFQKILLSLAIGALIGLERERRAKGEVAAGVRTFMLVCLLGLLSGFLADTLKNTTIIFVSILSVGLLSVLSYWKKVRKTSAAGFTTEIAFIITFVIGLINYYETYPYFLTIALGIILALILVSKETLHKFARKLTEVEMRDAVIFAMTIFIILPLLPNKTIDTWNALNPYLIWLSVVLVLFISFVGYVALKVFGTEKGVSLIGFLGGLASSTAVTVSMAERVKKNRKMAGMASFAVGLASSTMFLRIALISFLINSAVGLRLFVPLGLLAAIGYATSYSVLKKNSRKISDAAIGSPLALVSTLKFTVLLILILIVSALARSYFGEGALYAVAAVAGLVEPDAINVSFSSLALSGLNPETAAIGIVLACLANTFTKLLIAKWVGTKEMVKELIKIIGVILFAGVLILAFYLLA